MVQTGSPWVGLIRNWRGHGKPPFSEVEATEIVGSGKQKRRPHLIEWPPHTFLEMLCSPGYAAAGGWPANAAFTEALSKYQMTQM
jgi:hypothetical protein